MDKYSPGDIVRRNLEFSTVTYFMEYHQRIEIDVTPCSSCNTLKGDYSIIYELPMYESDSYSSFSACCAQCFNSLTQESVEQRTTM